MDFNPRYRNEQRGGDERRQQDNAVYSKKIKAGKKRTYFIDVRETKGKDYFLTITESTRRQDDDTFIKHKIFLYKEDFNRFAAALNETIDYVKTELMPDYDYDEFVRRHEEYEEEQNRLNNANPTEEKEKDGDNW